MGKHSFFTLTGLALALALPLAAAGTPRGAKPHGVAKTPARAINLNTASATELMQLPHIGQKTAERIVAFRKEHGAFHRTEEVMNVKGVGEKSFVQLKPFLTLSLPAAAK